VTARFLAEAEAELSAAAQAYADARMELAEHFLTAVIDAVTDIEKHPLRFASPPKLRTSRLVRRKLLKGFPYSLVYEVRESELLILAVAHTSRKPGYWRNRGTP